MDYLSVFYLSEYEQEFFADDNIPNEFHVLMAMRESLLQLHKELENPSFDGNINRFFHEAENFEAMHSAIGDNHPSNYIRALGFHDRLVKLTIRTFYILAKQRDPTLP